MKTKKFVFCVGTWPEDNYSDFKVFAVRQNETDDEAISRAKKEYPDGTFYIKEQ